MAGSEKIVRYTFFLEFEKKTTDQYILINQNPKSLTGKKNAWMKLMETIEDNPFDSEISLSKLVKATLKSTTELDAFTPEAINARPRKGKE